MLLNGWKEIANYLKCGVRTAQRWQEHLHLPVMRVRDSKRGPVISESAALDEWMKRRSSLLIAERTFEQSSAAMARAMRGGGNFLWLELETGRRFAQLARTSTHVSATARRRQAARRAYDTLQRFLSGKVTLPKSELKTFREELSEFRKELEQLGEVFDA